MYMSELLQEPTASVSVSMSEDVASSGGAASVSVESTNLTEEAPLKKKRYMNLFFFSVS